MKPQIKLHFHAVGFTSNQAGMPITISQITPGVLTALHTLMEEGIDEQAAEEGMDFASATEWLRFQKHLHEFNRAGLILYKLYADGELMATVEPFAPPRRAYLYKPEQKYRVSRFVYGRAEGQDWVLESPLSHCCIVLHDWRMMALLSNRPLPEGIVSAEVQAAFWRLLGEAGMLTRLDDKGQAEEDQQLALRRWKFHDLLFLSKVRQGSRARPERFELFSAAPALKAAMSEQVVPLPVPDMEAITLTDRPLTDVLEKRQTIRQYASQPITREQLSEFLYRTARVRQVRQGERYEVAARPYPGAGAVYELEIYVVVQHCQDVPAGVYYYQPQQHHLEQLPVKEEHRLALLEDAIQMAGSQIRQPQVLLTIAARFGRINWKYQTNALALVLQDVGVLYQTMYLVAEAMHLAPCALGGGAAEQFALLTGLEVHDETSVGEFFLGSRE